MSRTYTISPDPFLVVLKDEDGNSYSCNHMDMIELDGYSVHVPGIYDWYLYFNTYAEWTKHCMDKRFHEAQSCQSDRIVSQFAGGSTTHTPTLPDSCLR